MMRTIKAITVLAFIAIVLFAIYTKQYYLIMGAIATNFAIFAVQAGDDPSHDYSVMNRSVAMSFSKIPGLGQFYLKDRRKALMFLSVYPALLAIFMIMMAPEFRSDVAYLFAIMMVFIIFSMVASAINVEIICNKHGLPSMNKDRELGIKNYHKAYTMLMVSMFIVVVFFTALCFIYIEERTVWLYVAIPLIWALGAVITYYKTKDMSSDVSADSR